MLDNINTNSNGNAPSRSSNSNNSNNGNNNANNSIRPVMPNPLVQNVVNTSLPQGQIPFRPQSPQQVQPQMQQRPQQAQVQPQIQPQMQQPRSQTNSNKDSEEIIRYCRSLASDINLLKEQFANQMTELKLLLDKVVPTIEQNHHINNLAQQSIQQSIQQNFKQIVESVEALDSSNASLKSEFSQLVKANSKYISKDDFNKGVNFIVSRLSDSLSSITNLANSNNLNSNGSSDNNEVSEKIGQLTSSINNFAGQLAQVQKHQQLQQAQLKQLMDSLLTNASNSNIFGINKSVANASNAANIGKTNNPLANNKSASSNTNNSTSQSTNPIKQLLEKDIPLPFVSYQVNVKTLLIAVGVIGVLLLVVIGS